MEIWKDIKGYEGLYQVSNLGRIRSLYNNKIKFIKLFNKIKNDENSYLRVQLVKNKIVKKFSVHRIVALAFIENPENKPLINHKNTIKIDNRVSNLEWCTQSENIIHAYKNNLINLNTGRKIKCLNNNKEFKSSYAAAMWLNNYIFNNTKKVKHLAEQIRRVAKKKRNQTLGFKFEYIL